jgi:hypothetical protein
MFRALYAFEFLTHLPYRRQAAMLVICIQPEWKLGEEEVNKWGQWRRAGQRRRGGVRGGWGINRVILGNAMSKVEDTHVQLPFGCVPLQTKLRLHPFQHLPVTVPKAGGE